MKEILKIMFGFIGGMSFCFITFLIATSPYMIDGNVAFTLKRTPVPTATPTPLIQYVQAPVSPLSAPIPIPPLPVPECQVFMPLVGN